MENLQRQENPKGSTMGSTMLGIRLRQAILGGRFEVAGVLACLFI